MQKDVIKIKEIKMIELLSNILSSVTSNSNYYSSCKKMNSRSFTGLLKDGSFKEIMQYCHFYQFNIPDNKEIEFSYAIRISKSNKGYFYRDRFVCWVNISRKGGFLEKIDTFIIDSNIYKSYNIFETLKKIFSTMENIEKESNLKMESEKYNPYISDISKSIDKSVSRDDKLNELFGEFERITKKFIK
jgi:hypothetical protein